MRILNPKRANEIICFFSLQNLGSFIKKKFRNMVARYKRGFWWSLLMFSATAHLWDHKTIFEAEPQMWELILHCLQTKMNKLPCLVLHLQNSHVVFTRSWGRCIRKWICDIHPITLLGCNPCGSDDHVLWGIVEILRRYVYFSKKWIFFPLK